MKDYNITMPQGVTALIKLNELQQGIIDLKSEFSMLFSDEQKNKMDNAYNLLEEVQYWLVDNGMNKTLMLCETEGVFLLGEIFLYTKGLPSDFPLNKTE